MVKRIIGVVFLVPVAILLGFWCVNFVGAVMAGDINIVSYLLQHKVAIGLILAYFVFKFLNPFKD